MRPLLIIMLFGLVLALLGFVYWQFGTSWLPFSSTSTSGDVTPPQIQAIQTAATSDTSIIISWTTDELAIGQVEYGIDSNYGSFSSWEPGQVVSHSITLTGLSPSTTYHYSILEADKCRISMKYPGPAKPKGRRLEA